MSEGFDDLMVRIGELDGTWLEGLDATPDQKAAFTTLVSGVSRLPASGQMNSDLKNLLEAPFSESALVARDALIKAVLLVSQEQHAYLGERVTADEGPLIAGGGNDTLDGGVGADRMEGGNHTDLYVVDNVADGLLSAMAASVPADSSTSDSEAETGFIDMPISNPQMPTQAWI